MHDTAAEAGHAGAYEYVTTGSEIRDRSVLDLEAFAVQIGHPVALVRRWAEEGGCSVVGDAALTRMRAGDELHAMTSCGSSTVM